MSIRNNPERKSRFQNLVNLGLVSLAAIGVYKLAEPHLYPESTDNSRNIKPMVATDEAVEPNNDLQLAEGPRPVDSPFATETPLLIPEESADENPSLGVHPEGQPLHSGEAVAEHISDVLAYLEQHPEERENILANHRWLDDLLNSPTRWPETNYLNRDQRGLGFTESSLLAASQQYEAWQALFTPESWANSQNPNLRNSPDALLQFAVDPANLSETPEFGVEENGIRHYIVVSNNIENMQEAIFAFTSNAAAHAGFDNLDEIRQGATGVANVWRQEHGLTNAAGVTTVDTNGTALGGEVSFRHDPFLQVCEVYQVPVASNDPIDQTETTRQVDIVPLLDTELVTSIPWSSAQSNARGTFVTAMSFDMSKITDLSAETLLRASSQTTWNISDEYSNIPSSYESGENAIWYTFVPCAEPEIIPAPVIEPTPEPTQPPHEPTCEERGDCRPPTCEERGDCPEEEKGPRGETNPDGTLPEEMPTEAPADDTTPVEANQSPV